MNFCCQRGKFGFVCSRGCPQAHVQRTYEGYLRAGFAGRRHLSWLSSIVAGCGVPAWARLCSLLHALLPCACSWIWPSGQAVCSRAASSEEKARWRWYFPRESRTSLLRCHRRGPGPAGGCRQAWRRASQPEITCCCVHRQADTQGAGHHYIIIPISYLLGLTSISTQPK